MEAAGINPYDYEPQRNVPLDVESHGSSSSENDDEHQVDVNDNVMWTDSGIRTGVRVKGAPRCRKPMNVCAAEKCPSYRIN